MNRFLFSLRELWVKVQINNSIKLLDKDSYKLSEEYKINVFLNCMIYMINFCHIKPEI